MTEPSSRPAAILLCKTATGLATLRALATAGIDVYAVLFDARDPVRFSRHGHKIAFTGNEGDTTRLVQFVLALAIRIGGRPVVIPTSDRLALMLAEHASSLLPACRIWTTSYADLLGLVRKDRLYALASKAGLSAVPSISNASIDEVAAWSLDNPAPYLLKPVYVGIDACSMHTKNLVAPDRATLLGHVSRFGATALVIQRLMLGGDGEIYDIYGLCDADGRVRTMASHRRIRQYAPNLGATCYGAIPSGLGIEDHRLFEDTLRLLAATRFHGIFGVEWLRDRASGNFHLIDFNARPFLSIGHLHDCGLNLPLVAYRDLIGDDLSDVAPWPALRPKLWVDLLRDLRTHIAGSSAQHVPFPSWALSITRATSHAYWDWLDPGPGLKRAAELAHSFLSYAFKRIHLRITRMVGVPQKS